MLKKVIIILSCYMAYCILLYIIQRHLIFPGRNIAPPSGIPKVRGIQRVWLTTSSGRIEAWFIPAEGSSKNIKMPSVIFAHGNYEIIDYCIPDASRYNKLGFHALLVEFPGYGRSEGSPSEESIEEAFVTAYDWLAANPGVDSDRIIAHGRSLGGGAACLLASKRNISGLVLQSTFANTRQFAWRYLAPAFLVKDNFDNIAILKTFKKPVLIFHGKQDFVIPFKNGVKLSEAAEKSIFIPLKCRHNDCNIYGIDFTENIKRLIE